MSFDVSGLTAYVEQQRLPLLTSSVFGARTISMITAQPGIKKSDALNIIDTDVVLQDGTSCGFAASGVTTLSQRILTVAPIKVNERFCPKTLVPYWAQTQLKQGALPEKEQIPFEKIYSDKKVQLIQAALEQQVWIGDTNSGVNNYNKFDGFLKIIDATALAVAATSQAAINSSTVRGIFENIYSLIPTAVLDKDDLTTFCGVDTFRTLITKLTTDNLFHYTTDTAARSMEINYPGNNLRIVAVNGLNSTNRIVTARTSNMFYGTDMMNDEEKFELFYAKEADEVRFVVEWKSGVQVAFPQEIVTYKNS